MKSKISLDRLLDLENKGLSRKEIAKEVGLSVVTVNYRLSPLQKKLATFELNKKNFPESGLTKRHDICSACGESKVAGKIIVGGIYPVFLTKLCYQCWKTKEEE